MVFATTSACSPAVPGTAWTGDDPPRTLTIGQAETPLFPYEVDRTTPAWPPNSPTQRIAPDGALEIDYEKRYEGVGWQFSPVAAAQYCYQMHNAFVLSGQPVHREAILSLANSLLTRSEHSPQGILWRYNFPQASFGAEKGWISGMAQGLAVACLGSAYHLTGESKFKDGAMDAMAVLTAEFGDHGTAVRVGDGRYYEEVAGGESEPSHILNGMIFSVMGLWFYNELDPAPAVEEALRAGIRGVKHVLSDYDAPGISLYDLKFRRLARVGKDYNVVHVAQLQWLHQVTGDEAFGLAALRFMEHERTPLFTATASSEHPERPVENVDGSKSYYTAAEPGRVTIRLDFEKRRRLDKLMLVGYSDERAPRGVQLEAGDVTINRDLESRFSEFEFAAQDVDEVKVTLEPQENGRPIALALLGLNGPADRKLIAISSDTRSYRDGNRSTQREKRTPPEGSPLSASDGSSATSWNSDFDNAWLLVNLGRAPLEELSVAGCGDADKPIKISYSPDLSRWSPAQTLQGPTSMVPEGARFAHLLWPDGGACVQELRIR